MSLGLKVGVTGNKQLIDYLERFPVQARKAAKLAINDAIRRGRRKAKQEIMRQVNLKPGYLDGRDGKPRLESFFADENSLSGSIVGRRRPTSLARFDAKQLYQTGSKRPAGVVVKVNRARKKIPRAFLVSLKSGNRDGGNQGLAIRVPQGTKPKRRFNAKPLYQSKNTDVYLLYGPSVQQVFDDVAVELQPELSTYLNREFQRQFARLYGG